MKLDEAAVSLAARCMGGRPSHVPVLGTQRSCSMVIGAHCCWQLYGCSSPDVEQCRACKLSLTWQSLVFLQDR